MKRFLLMTLNQIIIYKYIEEGSVRREKEGKGRGIARRDCSKI